MPSEGHKNKRSAMLLKILNHFRQDETNEAKAIANLQQCYDDLILQMKKRGYISIGPENASGQIYALNYK